MVYLNNFIKNRYIAVADIIFIILSYIFVYFLCDKINLLFVSSYLILMSCVIYFGIFCLFKVYRRWWPYGSTKDFVALIFSCVLSALICSVFSYFLRPDSQKMREVFGAHVIILFSVTSLRLAARAVDRGIKHINRVKASDGKGKKVLIYGAGGGAMLFLREVLASNECTYNIVGLIDDDKAKRSLVLYGYSVLGSGNDLKRICSKYNIDEIIIAIPSADAATKGRVARSCADTGCAIKTLPSLEEIISGKSVSGVRRVEIEDLLERQPIKLDNKGLKGLIRHRVIAVTGGGGSIGSELCRQIAVYDPELLIIIDIYENNAYDLQNDLKRKYPDLNMEVLIASVRDKNRIDEIFREYRPEIVFHAAAHKHVPLMEDSPSEAVKNNVFGTYNVALSAMEHDVSRFVMISTDKAVNPTNVMGATKRICEMIVQSLQGQSNTEFVAVRFGNVLGSNGSVIPLFKKQIEDGGPVTLTDKRIIRYFMTIPEAAQLVLQAASYACGGEIFVLDMGEPVKIYDLAVNLIKLSGYTPDVDIKIKEVGLRPGEKLYEELLMSEEGLTKTEHSKIFIGRPIGITYNQVLNNLEVLKKALETKDNMLIKEAVAKVVPTYHIDKRYCHDTANAKINEKSEHTVGAC